MINFIIAGISKKLNEVFGDEYDIYTEQVAQGMKEPCFYILSVNAVNKPMLGARYLRTYSFCVKYFPKSNTGPNAECNNISDDLFLALEYIAADGSMMQGMNMQSHSADGFLEFTVDYEFFIRAIPESEPMENMLFENNVKG